jgi:hypothetical protein
VDDSVTGFREMLVRSFECYPAQKNRSDPLSEAPKERKR